MCVCVCVRACVCVIQLMLLPGRFSIEHRCKGKQMRANTSCI